MSYSYIKKNIKLVYSPDSSYDNDPEYAELVNKHNFIFKEYWKNHPVFFNTLEKNKEKEKEIEIKEIKEIKEEGIYMSHKKQYHIIKIKKELINDPTIFNNHLDKLLVRVEFIAKDIGISVRTLYKWNEVHELNIIHSGAVDMIKFIEFLKESNLYDLIEDNKKESKKVTHVKIQEDFVVYSGRIELNDDNLGYVESYDFSRANMNLESRIAAITTIASVCYGNPKALGSISLYNRLQAESAGLPSSSYEFVPILLSVEQVREVLDDYGIIDIDSLLINNKNWKIIKYGELIKFNKNNEAQYLLTNLRALIEDVGSERSQNEEFFNTSEEEIEIIRNNFKIYKAHIDLSTRAQFIRHRMSPQELSRRYVDSKREPFSFYISQKMKNIKISMGDDGTGTEWFTNTSNVINMCLDHYEEALKQGVKPEEARRILPQAMYTTVWSAWQPNQLDNFFKLRLDKHAQSEIQELAQGMKDLL